MKSSFIIAASLGMDSSEINDYRYQPTRTARAIFAVDESYFAVGKTAPKDLSSLVWKKHSDQFWAAKYNTTLWVAESSSADAEWFLTASPPW